ncbi:MAG: hypothetical protein ACLSVD_15550 [Eggerthellaceae bacterium]
MLGILLVIGGIVNAVRAMGCAAIRRRVGRRARGPSPSLSASSSSSTVRVDGGRARAGVLLHLEGVDLLISMWFSNATKDFR